MNLGLTEFQLFIAKESKEFDNVVIHSVKFTTQDDERCIKCQTNDKKGDSNVHRKGDHEYIKLWKYAGKNSKNEIGKKEQSKDWGAEFNAEHEQVASQIHQFWNNAG